jgi:Holliday junction resolvase
MAISRGKQFETKFKEDWIRTVPNSFILRLPDQVSNFAGYSSNICDFIAYNYPNLFLIECKTIHGNTLPFSNLTQFEKLVQYKDIKGVYPGVVVWWIDRDVVAWISIETVIKMKQDENKSINVKMVEEKVYDILTIPSVKKRVFLDSDYSVIINLIGGKN